MYHPCTSEYYQITVCGGSDTEFECELPKKKELVEKLSQTNDGMPVPSVLTQDELYVILKMILEFSQKLAHASSALPRCAVSPFSICPKNYEANKRFFRDLNNEKEYECIILPVVEGEKFTLLVLDFKKHLILYYQPDRKEEEEKKSREKQISVVAAICFDHLSVYKPFADASGRWGVVLTTGNASGAYTREPALCVALLAMFHVLDVDLGNTRVTESFADFFRQYIARSLCIGSIDTTPYLAVATDTELF